MMKKFTAIITSTINDTSNVSTKRVEFAYSNDAIIEINRQINEMSMNSSPIPVKLKFINKKEKKQNTIITDLKTVHGDEGLSKEEIVIGFLSESKLIKKDNELLVEASVIITDASIAKKVEGNKSLYIFYPVILFNESKGLRQRKSGVYDVMLPVRIAMVNVGARRSSGNPNVCIS